MSSCIINPLIIRKIIERDLKPVYEIEKASFQDPWEFSSFTEEMNRKNGIFYVAEINNTIAGYIIFWIVLDEIHILNIATHISFRHKGVATCLIEHCLRFAKINLIKYCILEVRENNFDAQKLYKKFGFERIYVRKKYYSNEENAIVMGLTLNG